MEILRKRGEYLFISHSDQCWWRMDRAHIHLQIHHYHADWWWRHRAWRYPRAVWWPHAHILWMGPLELSWHRSGGWWKF